MKNIFNLVIILTLACCNNESKNSSKTDGQLTVATQERNDIDSNTATMNSGANEKEVKTDGTGKQSERENTNGNSANPDAVGDDPLNAKTNSTDPGNRSTGSVDDASDQNNTKGDLTNGDEKMIVYIGIFARWNYRAGEQFDGSYDTTNSLFVFCSTNRCKEVPRTQIVFQEFGSCDTSIADRIKLFKRKKNGSVNPNGERIKVVDNKGLIKVGNTTRVIEFDQPTIRRIKKANSISGVNTFQPASPAQRAKEVSVPEPTLQKQEIKPKKIESVIVKPHQELNDLQSVNTGVKSQPVLVKLDSSTRKQQTIIRGISKESVKPVNKDIPAEKKSTRSQTQKLKQQ